MAEEKLFTELDELAVANFDATTDEVLVYDASEPDITKKMKRMKGSGIKGSVSGKIIRIYEDGPKEADTYWIDGGTLWRTKSSFNSAAAPVAGSYWEKILLGGTSAFADLTGVPGDNITLATALGSKASTTDLALKVSNAQPTLTTVAKNVVPAIIELDQRVRAADNDQKSLKLYKYANFPNSI